MMLEMSGVRQAAEVFHLVSDSGPGPGSGLGLRATKYATFDLIIIGLYCLSAFTTAFSKHILVN